MADDIKFSVLASLFTWMQRSKSSAKKRLKFRKFLDTFCKPSDYFSSIRLILPNLDRERGTYGLKESVLATCIIDALGMSRESEDAVKLINWRKGGAKTGSNAGNFALVAAEVLQRRQGMISGGLSIKELNETLDNLASKDNRGEKTSILSNLIRRTNAQEMKWIVMIILKDLKLGITEKSIFHEFHPDAEDIFNVTCDLKLVCEKLKDRRQRHKRQDIEVGKAVRPQLAMRVSNANIAWKKLHGNKVVVECKFDGDRIQIHKNGTELHFFSRNYLDHAEYEPAMSDVIIHNVLVDRCILDGEMLVWDYSLNRFAEFGSNQEIAKAAKDGLDGNRQLCYVAFDILYAGDTSVIHQSLKERHELLHKVVKPLKGRLEILLPVDNLKVERPSGESCWSTIANSVDDVERFFKDTIENSSNILPIELEKPVDLCLKSMSVRDEGVVIKDLDSKWEPGDRSGKWLKLKPDYIRAGSDLDVLIIGGYYGSGRRGGEVAQFLVGLADRPSSYTYPTRFISFCRVGTGLSDDELNTVVNKLKPYFRKNDYPKSAPPKFYQVTNNSKERPDVWIESPEKSLILSVTSDIRTINSEVFAAPYSLRFPRVDRVRYDKPWHECLDVQSFIHLVQSSNGTTKGVTDYSGLQYGKPKQVKSSRKREKRIVPVVPSHLVQTDISDIKGDSFIFSNMMFYIANVPPNYSIDSIHKMIVENAGTFSMNLNNSVTHCVAATSKGIRYEAAKRHGDVINCSWIMDSSSQKTLIPLQPKYFLHLSDSSKKKLLEEIDEYSDSYYCDLQSAEDIKQLLDSMKRSEDTKSIDYYKRKFCPEGIWCRFLDCNIYFHLLVESLKADCEILSILSLRRLKVDVIMGGGKICDDIASATHLIVFSEPGTDTNFETVLKSITATEKNFLLNHKLQIVGSQWLEDCMEQGERLKEDSYSLKPIGMKEPNEKGKRTQERCESNPSSPTMLDDSKKPQIIFSLKQGEKRGRKTVEKPPLLASSGKVAKRNAGRSSRTISQKGKAPVVQTQRPRIQKRKGPAKICDDDELDETSSNEENTVEKTEAVNKKPKIARQKSSDVEEVEKVVEAGEPSQRGEVNETEFIENGSSGRYNVQDIDNMKKLEHTTDPVEAMLLDMIPSLGLKKIETPKEEFPEKQPLDHDMILAKKKKVSYKDVADKLLKDW